MSGSKTKTIQRVLTLLKTSPVFARHFALEHHEWEHNLQLMTEEKLQEALLILTEEKSLFEALHQEKTRKKEIIHARHA